MPELALTTLDDLTVLSARGADAVPFLQGQLSQDLALLPTRNAVLAGLHNAQGRCLAVLRVLRLADDHLLIVLPAELAGAVRQALSRYVLRARVQIEDAGATWGVYGATGPDAAAAASTRLSMAMDASEMRQLIVAPRGEPMPDGEVSGLDEWRLDDIAAGIPTIVTATSGLFVAQMLNLDLLDAIGLAKGCYTGQEVIARAHYRGQVKRRMQRFCTDSAERLPPAARVQLGDGRSAQIVIAAPAHGGGQEFLAVTTRAQSVDSATEFVEPGLSGQVVVIRSEPLPLPYGDALAASR
jgi:tRNA-modifying protein YgfZ